MSENKTTKRQDKKLHLNKETLRDLSVSENVAKKAVGGKAMGNESDGGSCATCDLCVGRRP
jgi:hypothetical protein